MPHGSVHKVVVSFGNGSPVKYNLLRGVKLQTQIDLLLQLLKAGWLTKQGKRVKNWKRRWFVLKDQKLSYFKSPTVGK